LEEVGYVLQREDPGYGIFLHNVEVAPAPELLGGAFPIGIGMHRQSVTIRMHWPSLEKLSLCALAEVFKHELLHFMFGHISSRRQLCVRKYGAEIYNVACDLVVNQYVNVDLLQAEGMVPCTTELFSFYDRETTEYYCAELYKNADGRMRSVLVDFTGEVHDGKKGERRLFGSTPCLWEQFEAPQDESGVEDVAQEQTLSRIKQEIALSGIHSTAKGKRGWEAGEVEEFIQQVRRPPQMPWFAFLRALESRYRGHDRFPTILRPSRRHPLHMGRMRKGHLLVWFGVDTSGSMGKEQLSLVDAELKGIAQRDAKIVLLQVDAEIQSKTIYNPRTGLGVLRGRGGTDFSPFLLALRDLPGSEKPHFAVFFTDGYGTIGAYKQRCIEEMGKARWLEFSESGSVRTPEGLELLWLIPEGSIKREQFKRIAPFGHFAEISSEAGL
jgi:predicted metal-dependent peptidase